MDFLLANVCVCHFYKSCVFCHPFKQTMVILMVFIGITHVVSSSKVLIPLRLLLEISDHQQVILLFDDFASICQ